MASTHFGDYRVNQDLDQKPVLFSLRVESRVWSNDVPMDRTTDLEIALSFVVHRVEEQAKASGQPLNAEEHSLLKNLPSSDVNYPLWAPDLGPPELVPRNLSDSVANKGSVPT